MPEPARPTPPRGPRCPMALPLPHEPQERVLLALVRRMAIHGLHDSSAAMLALHHFGGDFRRPLTLLRCFMHELACCSNRNIRLAPCCAPRMTLDEALILDSVMLGELASMEALTEADDPQRPFTIAETLRGEFEQLGRRFARAGARRR